MRKQEFLDALNAHLSALPMQERTDHLNFYAEMIDDRIEEGISEEDAVAEIGSIEEIARQILSEHSDAVGTKTQHAPKKKSNVTVIILLILGSPIWLSLLVAAAAVILSLYAVLWSVLISLWAGFVSLAACGMAGIAAGIGFAIDAGLSIGLVAVGAGLVCAGLAIFWFFLCRAASVGTLQLTKKPILALKKRAGRKEVQV